MSDRHWWECAPREGFTVHAREETAKQQIPKDVRAMLRWIEEFQAVQEARSLGMRERVFR